MHGWAHLHKHHAHQTSTRFRAGEGGPVHSMNFPVDSTPTKLVDTKKYLDPEGTLDALRLVMARLISLILSSPPPDHLYHTPLLTIHTSAEEAHHFTTRCCHRQAPTSTYMMIENQPLKDITPTKRETCRLSAPTHGMTTQYVADIGVRFTSHTSVARSHCPGRKNPEPRMIPSSSNTAESN